MEVIPFMEHFLFIMPSLPGSFLFARDVACFGNKLVSFFYFHFISFYFFKVARAFTRENKNSNTRGGKLVEEEENLTSQAIL